MQGKRILLIVAGGIAAYKSLELVRRLKERGARVRAVLTRAGAEFVTPLSLAALTEEKVYQDLFSLTDESEMGHIELSRDADLLLVAPATADLLARMAAGLADDLAATALLATDKPVLVAPAMNVRMWEHPATRANVRTLAQRGVLQVGPEEGDMACGERGLGRMAEPDAIVAAVQAFFGTAPAAGAEATLRGRRALVTSGPTHEPIDPVRYIANRSSGKQGHAIAGALARLGADTVLVSGPSHEPDPLGVTVVRVESALEMLAACKRALPVDVAVMAAAVADWRVASPRPAKIKKGRAAAPPKLDLAANPDILTTLAQAGKARPKLLVGFAAETEAVVENGKAKLARKGCDWIVANDVAPGAAFGRDTNVVHLIARVAGKVRVEHWPELSKQAIAERLAARVAAVLGRKR